MNLEGRLGYLRYTRKRVLSQSDAGPNIPWEKCDYMVHGLAQWPLVMLIELFVCLSSVALDSMYPRYDYCHPFEC